MNTSNSPGLIVQRARSIMSAPVSRGDALVRVALRSVFVCRRLVVVSPYPGDLFPAARTFRTDFFADSGSFSAIGLANVVRWSINISS